MNRHDILDLVRTWCRFLPARTKSYLRLSTSVSRASRLQAIPTRIPFFPTNAVCSGRSIKFAHTMEEVRNKKNRVLMMGINFSPELTGIGKYSGEMAEWFSVNGYHCTVVTSFPYYPYWKIQAPYTGRFYRKEVRQQGNLEIYRCPLYVPAAPTGMRRILQDFSFLLSSFFVVIYLLFKPKHDYIFCMAPPFHLGFLALLYRFIKGGKLVYHVHDLQIEAARDFNILRVKSLFNVLFGLERIIIN